MRVRHPFFIPFEHVADVERLEEVACNLCHSRAYRCLLREGPFELRECADCGLGYVSPQPADEEFPAFYEAMYPERTDEAAEARTLGYIEAQIRRIIHRRRPGVRSLLDAGCGYGLFLKHMEADGLRLAGFDYSTTAIEYARELVPDADLRQGAGTEVEFPLASFDCVTMLASLEHVRDPRAMLERARDWLTPGGLLVVLVPYVNPFIKAQRYVPFVSPVTLGAPSHLYGFTPATMARYFRETGFDEVKTDIGRPYCAKGAVSHALIWAVKAPGFLLHALTGGRYVYPFAAAFATHGIKQ